MSSFFCWCGGASAHLVDDTPEEKSRLATIGGTVLFTGVFAVASSAYALFTIFNEINLWIALIAVLWGAMIFNLDRLMVMTIKGDLLRRLLAALPRVLLATVIAFVVARPLELWIFKAEIDQSLSTQFTSANDALDRELQEQIDAAHASYKKKVEEETQAAEDPNEKLYRECEQDLKAAQDKYDNEIGGHGATGKIGRGKEAIRIDEDVRAIRRRCAQLANKRETATAEKAKLLEEILKRQATARDQAILRAKANHKIKTSELVRTNSESLLSRHRALSTLSKGDSSVRWMIGFVTLLFWLVEILPVAAKLMTPNSIYDSIVEERQRARKFRSEGAKDAEISWHTEGKQASLDEIEETRARRSRAAELRHKAADFHFQAIEEALAATQAAWRLPPETVEQGVARLKQLTSESLKTGARDTGLKPSWQLSLALPAKERLTRYRRMALTTVLVALVIVAAVKIQQLFGIDLSAGYPAAISIGGVVGTILTWPTLAPRPSNQEPPDAEP